MFLPLLQLLIIRGVMNKKAFLFDLDMTLLDTSALSQYRKDKQWGMVFSRLDLVNQFDAPSFYPSQLPGRLMARGHPVAIVTSSPKKYAEELLTRFEIKYDVLVTYHDTEEHKPDPAPLLLALEKLGCEPLNAIHVGDEATDMQACFRAGGIPVGAGWSIGNLDNAIIDNAPDYLIHDPDILLCEDLEGYSYILEEASAYKRITFHNGSFLRWKGESEDCFALGRYFTDKDPRHAHSVLSKRLLEFKDFPERYDFFKEILTIFIQKVFQKYRPEDITFTCVPPWEGKPNRFTGIFEYLQEYLPQGIHFAPMGLRPIKQITNYKTLGKFERSSTISKAFTTDREWAKLVVLFDDVFTTGNTTRECAQVLRRNGAKDVKVVALVKTQRVDDNMLKVCPKCGRTLKIYRRGSDGHPFWGCPGYWKEDKCNQVEDIPI